MKFIVLDLYGQEFVNPFGELQTGENPPLLECAPACIVATILVHGPEPVEFAERAASHVCKNSNRKGMRTKSFEKAASDDHSVPVARDVVREGESIHGRALLQSK
ncbi:hypothetical protein CB1_001111012 [Camelus ferus]|nr:hypothetical protein CB1_001111012 [Camelus ferus]